MEEIWKQIDYGNGNYYVSSMGRVKNSNSSYSRCVYGKDIIQGNGNEKILTAWDNGNGYLLICLSVNKKRKNFYIHRLVAEAFIGNITKGMVINHKDYNKKNNCVDNLEICTQKDNVNYSRERMFKQRSVIKSKTGYKNIRFKDNRYEVNISEKGKHKYIGRFINILDAINARDLAYEKIHTDR